MVRLKEHAFSCVHGRQRQFQFHYGTIKRSISPTDTEVFPEFQFHYGTIKRTRNSFVASKAMIFQFHYGTIKRPVNSVAYPYARRISIPLWYD